MRLLCRLGTFHLVFVVAQEEDGDRVAVPACLDGGSAVKSVSEETKSVAFCLLSATENP